MKERLKVFRGIIVMLIFTLISCQEDHPSDINSNKNPLFNEIGLANKFIKQNFDTLTSELNMKDDLYIDWQNSSKIGRGDTSILVVPIGLGDNALGYWVPNDDKNKEA